METEVKTATLSLSENFYSVQCEGASTGYPAYFIRLKGCNLMCGGKGGSLMKEGKATWWCDSEAVWRQGKQTDIEVIINDWEKEDILDWVLSGRVHLIWTGGEPALPKHQKNIVECINYLDKKYEDRGHSTMNTSYKLPLYNEIETNGTKYIEDDLFRRLSQINCSVKLANSGMPFERRFCAASLKRIMSHPNYWFKFVISEEKDLEEIHDDFIRPLAIPPHKVLMMPGLDKQINFHERTRFCLEMAKKHGYIGLSRLHISSWDQVTGV
jgi:7-carboxy-7-deazaguanine synthase